MTEIHLNIIKAIAITGTSIVAIITLIKGYLEYKLTSTQKRSEFYERLGTKLETDETLKLIIHYLETNDTEIRNLARFERYKFLRFYEDIALIMNSDLIKPEIAHYMFSYYAVKCFDSDDFWHDIERNSIYWRVFNEFVEKMKKMENQNLTIPQNEKIKFKI
jgi:NDP-sugar pyrophosphorylase family protein